MPPVAYIPYRNGSVSFSADSPPVYDPNRTVTPKDPTSGRDNNHGLEGLTITADGLTLYALMQSALNQEGGPNNPYRRQARLLEYDISNFVPVYKAEFVVTLPLFTDPTAKAFKATKVAAQSEIHSLGDGQFLILARDSNAGHGGASSTSVYRHADIFDISGSSGATDIKSPTNDAVNGSVAFETGMLDAGITAAEYCPFLDFNINSQLGRFGVHNGGPQDSGLLNEKWESLAMVPVDGKEGKDGEWFLISLSDNDFITQDGELYLLPVSFSPLPFVFPFPLAASLAALTIHLSVLSPNGEEGCKSKTHDRCSIIERSTHADNISTRRISQRGRLPVQRRLRLQPRQPSSSVPDPSPEGCTAIIDFL